MQRFVSRWFWVICLLLASNFLVITEESAPPAKNKGLPSPKKSEAEKLIKKYFTAKDSAEKTGLLNELAKYDDEVSPSDLAAFAKIIWPLVKQNSKPDGKNPAKCTHPDYPGEYFISVPADAKAGKKTGIFIGLHGYKCDGDNMRACYGNPNPKLIGVYPNVLDKSNGSAWKTETAEKYVIEIINDLKRAYNIDTNQIYLAGHSMGAQGTWSIGSHYADIFAALAPMSGAGSTSGVLANLKNTPVWFYHSADDKTISVEPDRQAAETLKGYKEKYGPYDFTYKEYSDIGHGFPKEGFKHIWDWMFSKKRDPYPKQVIWEPGRAYKQIFYWLKIANPPLGQRIEAKIDANKISIQGGLAEFSVFLNDKLADFKKPVVVTVNGEEKFNGLAGYSLSALVETIDDKKDPEMYFTSQIKIQGDVKGR
jgi:predicted esterase